MRQTHSREGVPRITFGSVSEAVEPLALGQCEGLAHSGALDRGPGDQVLTFLDGEVQGHQAGFQIDTQENRTGTPIANLLQGRTFGEIGHLLLQALMVAVSESCATVAARPSTVVCSVVIWSVFTAN